MKIEKIDIHKMIEKDIDETFFELGLMYKKQTNYKTMHNFGTLISKYGKEISFCSKKNIEYATELLLSAKKQNPSFITLKELGDIYLSQKEYKEAISYYTDALNKKMPYALCYNLSSCYYHLQDYTNMKIILEQATVVSNFTNFEIISLQEVFALAAAVFGDKHTALKLFKNLLNNPAYEINPETIKLAYLCGEYSFISQNYISAFSGWILNAVDYKILSKVFDEANPKQFAEFEKWIEETVFKFYIKNPDFEQDLDLINAIKNKECITKIELSLNPIFSCDFY